MGNVGYLRMQRLFQVLQNGTAGYDAVLQVLHAKAFQRLHVKVLQQLLVCRLVSKHPVIEFERAVAGTKQALEVLLARAVVEHLLGLYVGEQLLYVVVGAFACEELTRRDVEERDATGSFSEVYGRQKVVLLIVQHGVAHGNTGRHQLRNAALDQFLGQLGVFELVADGHALAGTDEFWQISVEGVMRETSHFVALHACPVVTFCQRNTKDP